MDACRSLTKHGTDTYAKDTRVSTQLEKNVNVKSSFLAICVAASFCPTADAADRTITARTIDITHNFVQPAYGSTAIKLVAGDSYRSGTLITVPSDARLLVRHVSGSCGSTAPFSDARVMFALGWTDGTSRGEHELQTLEREVSNRALSTTSQAIELLVGPGETVKATIYRATGSSAEVSCAVSLTGYLLPLN